MNQSNAGARPPLSFWVVSIAGLLWNSLGAAMYLAAKLRPELVMADAPPGMQDYVSHMPLWGHLGWSLGIWASFAGSVLMLLRSRRAGTAFAASLAGALASFAEQARAGVLEAAQPILIVIVIVYLWRFSTREAAKGTLR